MKAYALLSLDEELHEGIDSNTVNRKRLGSFGIQGVFLVRYALHL